MDSEFAPGNVAKQKFESALVFATHPDDETIGPGGTIAKLAKLGVNVYLVTFATGNEGYSKLEDRGEKVREVRKNELLAAAKILGIKEVELLGSYVDDDGIRHEYTDYEVPYNKFSYYQAIQMIRKYRPQIILTHNGPADYESHNNVNRIVTEAWQQAMWNSSLELGDPWTANALYYFEVLNDIPKPTHIVDITDTFDVKVKAMKEGHSSQLTVVKDAKSVVDILQLIQGRSLARGYRIGVKRGEALLKSNFLSKKIDDLNGLL